MNLEMEIKILTSAVDLVECAYSQIIHPCWELEEDEEYKDLKDLLKHKQIELAKQLGVELKFYYEYLIKAIEEHKNK